MAAILLRRRQAWVEGKVCKDCGAADSGGSRSRGRLAPIDPDTGLSLKALWGTQEYKREEFLRTAIPACHDCRIARRAAATPEYQQFQRFYDGGLTGAAAANRLGLTGEERELFMARYRRWLRRNNHKVRTTRYTPEFKMRIQELSAQGMRNRDIAIEMDTTQGVVWEFLNRARP